MINEVETYVAGKLGVLLGEDDLWSLYDGPVLHLLNVLPVVFLPSHNKYMNTRNRA